MPSSAVTYRSEDSHVQTIFISSRALCDILHETLEHLDTETGGVLLGVRNGDSWYVVEALDPGPKAAFSSVTFEYDHDYLTHLANKVARKYRSRMQLLGLWHRHPGSLDVFSSTDDGTNLKYVELGGGVAISGLVNIDPDFRMTFYSVKGNPLRYAPMRIVEGDSAFPTEFLETWEVEKLRDNLKPRSLVLSKGRALPGFEERVSATRTFKEGDASLSPRPSRRGCLGSLIFGSKTQKSKKTGAFNEQRVSEMAPSKSLAPGDGGSKTLEMIDGELGYLLTQRDYSYELIPSDSGVELRLNLVTRIHGYPAAMDFLFCEREGKLFVFVDDHETPYEEGIVEASINGAISKNMGRHDSRDL